MRILVFDTETTGIIPKKSSTDEIIPLEQYPSIVQLSFIVYDTMTKTIVKSSDHIIDVAKYMPIPQVTIDVHNITNEISIEKGIPIRVAIQDFINELYCCDYLVAHNLNFDNTMINKELERMNLDSNKILQNEKLKRVERYCTMSKGRYLSKMDKTSPTGKTYFKSPRQYELHEHLFGTVPENLHNSYHDILVCLRIFVKMRFKYDICMVNLEFADIFQNTLNVKI